MVEKRQREEGEEEGEIEAKAAKHELVCEGCDGEIGSTSDVYTCSGFYCSLLLCADCYTSPNRGWPIVDGRLFCDECAVIVYRTYAYLPTVHDALRGVLYKDLLDYVCSVSNVAMIKKQLVEALKDADDLTVAAEDRLIHLFRHELNFTIDSELMAAVEAKRDMLPRLYEVVCAKTKKSE